MDDDPPVGTAQGLFHLTDGGAAYAGPYLHDHDPPVHTHSFVEIAFVVSGTAIHKCLNGRRELEPGGALLLRPGVWHGYEQCRDLTVYNCCFSSELLRRELSWTREDPLLGYLLWAGPYSSPARGVLVTSLSSPAFGECLAHLDALAALRSCPPHRHRGDVIGRLALLFSQLVSATTYRKRFATPTAHLSHAAEVLGMPLEPGQKGNSR